MKTLQKTLRKILTREEFVEKFYSKSKSLGSKSVITSVLNVFDDFCVKVYGKDAEKMLGYGDDAEITKQSICKIKRKSLYLTTELEHFYQSMLLHAA